MKHRIDISSEEKRKEIYEIFNSLKSKNQIHEYFKISDNKNGSEYIKEIANEIGFDLNIYKERKKKYCLQCGKELTKGQKKFCSLTCANSFNNTLRVLSNETKEKISNSLKNKCKVNKNIINRQTLEKKKNVCFECGKEFENVRKMKFCSNECAAKYRHKESYKYFLENSEKFCRGNYTPKKFKDFIIEEQGGVCAICGNPPTWNNKDLVFIIDHIDGDASNNKRDNLRCICPNCDSQLDTYKSKNKNSARRNYWREKIINDLMNNGQ